MARNPAVAGTFYESDPEALRLQVEALLKVPSGRSPAIAVVAPHAAYSFSGAIAGRVYARVEVPDRVIVLAPNHTGLGASAAVGTESPWSVPGRDVPVDADLARALLEGCAGLAEDDLAHAEEHAIEVHLPFLIACNPAVRIVPVCLRTMSYEMCEALGRAIAAVVTESGGNILIVASSDMNHHEPLRVAERKDRMALDRLLDLDARGLYQAVVEHHVSMCGLVPAVVALVAARALGARHADLAGYGTSGDVDGDLSSVVGYAGVVVTRQRTRPPLTSLNGGAHILRTR